MTTQANTYTVLAGPPSFMRPDFNVSSFYPKNFKEHLGSSYRFQHVKPYDLVDVAQEFHARMQDATAFEHLSLSQCHEGYSHQYLSSWGDLFLEIYPALVPSNNSHCTDDTRGLNSPNAEICWSMAWNDRAMTWSRIPQNTSISEVGSSLSNSSLADPFGSMSRVPTYFALSDPSSYPSYQWRDRNYSEKKSLYLNCVYNKINYSTASPVSGKEMRCRAERVPESCTLNFNLSFALIVITCNLIKLLTMSLTLSRHRAPALITTGDAIDSFLREPDETTSGLCLFSGASMYLHWEWRRGTFETSLQWKKIKQRRLDSLSSPVYEPERWFWGQSASPMRWIMCFILYVVTQPCHATHY